MWFTFKGLADGILSPLTERVALQQWANVALFYFVFLKRNLFEISLMAEFSRDHAIRERL